MIRAIPRLSTTSTTLLLLLSLARLLCPATATPRPAPDHRRCSVAPSLLIPLYATYPSLLSATSPCCSVSRDLQTQAQVDCILGFDVAVGARQCQVEALDIPQVAVRRREEKEEASASDAVAFWQLVKSAKRLEECCWEKAPGTLRALGQQNQKGLLVGSTNSGDECDGVVLIRASLLEGHAGQVEIWKGAETTNGTWRGGDGSVGEVRRAPAMAAFITYDC